MGMVLIHLYGQIIITLDCNGDDNQVLIVLCKYQTILISRFIFNFILVFILELNVIVRHTKFVCFQFSSEM